MPTLRSVRLLVDDFKKSFDFYHNVMGFEIAWGDEHGAYAEFKVAPDVSVSIFQKDIMMQTLKDEGKEHDPSDDIMLIFKASDTVDSDYEKFTDTNAVKLIAPEDREKWGVRAAHVRDPAGNLIEINKGFDE